MSPGSCASRGAWRSACESAPSSRRASSRARGRWYVIRRHLFPNAIGPTLVGVSLTAAYTLLAAATLSYLGLGTPPPAPSWGNMLQASFDTVFQDWRYGIWPGLCIVIVALGYMLVSEGIEVAVQRSGSAGAAAVVDAPGVTPLTAGGTHRECGLVRQDAALSESGPAVPTSSDVVLAIADLVVDFPLEGRTIRAVDGLSLTIRPGQRLGVVGESGLGKSTVALAVLGLLEAPGRIAWRLDPARRPRAERREGRCAPERARRPHRDDLPGRARLPQPGQDDRVPADRGDQAPHRRGQGRSPSSARSSCSPRSACRRPGRGSTSIRTSSRAGCGSA